MARSGQIGTHGSRTDGDVLDAIDDGLGRGRSARQVHGELNANQRFAGRVPSLKTISRRAKEFRPPSPEERWSLAEADPEEVAVVLPVFAAMAKMDKVWKCRFVTKEQAQMLLRIKAAAPDLDPWVSYEVVEWLALRRGRGLETLGLELGLALAPWRSELSAAEFRRVLEAGFLDKGLSADARLVEHESTLDPLVESISRQEERAYAAELGGEDQVEILTEAERGDRYEQMLRALRDGGLAGAEPEAENPPD